MPRTSRNSNLDEIIRAAVEPVIERASAAIARAIAEMAEARVSRQLTSAVSAGRQRRTRRVAGRRRRRNVEMTRWTADRRARRVPTFVIEATGLDTKKKIVAKFGDNVTFERGKPLPAPKSATVTGVTARPPRIRKAAATA